MFEKYLMLFVYFSSLLGLSYLASKRVKDLKDYFAGGKELGYWVAAFSTQATGESAWLLLGLTGMGAMIGVTAYWVVVGEVLGVFVAWFMMAKRFKRLTDYYDSLTMTDFLVSRLRPQTNTLRFLAAFTLAIFSLVYISAQIDATGSAFERFLGWDYFVGAVFGFAVVVIYCVTGGFLAVAWTDLVQGVVMLVCLVMLPLITLIGLADLPEIMGGLRVVDPALLGFFGGHGPNIMGAMTVLGMMLIGLGFLGSPQIFARFIAIKDEEELKKGKWVAVIFTFLVGVSAVSIGILGRYIFTGVDVDPEIVMGNGAQNVLPDLVDYNFPPLIVGLYVAAVLSAIMSTVSSLLIMAAGSVTNDLYKKIYRPDLAGEAASRVSRWVTFGLAILSLVLAITVAMVSPDRTIFWFAIFGWSGIAATFCPAVILSLFWRGYTVSGAISSIVVGFLSIPIFKFVVQDIDSVGSYFIALEALPPAFIASLLVGICASKLRPQNNLEETYTQELIELQSSKTR